MRKYWYLACCVLLLAADVRAVEASVLFDSLRKKILVVKDYKAEVKMKINVRFMRIPELGGTLYFKAPDKMRLERHGGLSILPKKNNNLILRNLLPTGKVTVLDAGTAMLAGKQVRVIKIIPEDEGSDIVLTKIWIDESRLLALKTETVTHTQGTLQMDLEYGRYVNYGLPDHVTLTMDVKDFKMPKAMTMDYVESNTAPLPDDGKGRKGTIQIKYLQYDINTGLSDDVFRQKE